MPLVKLTRGARYQFDNILVQKGEVIEVDARTRNRLVRSGHFIDVQDHERPAFIAMAEDDGPTHVQGGVSLDDIDDPGLLGAKPEAEVATGPQGARGKGEVHRRSNSEKLNERAAAATEEKPQVDPEVDAEEVAEVGV